MADPAQSLVLALGGFTVSAETEHSELRGPALLGTTAAAAVTGRPGRQVAVGTDTLVAHASTIANTVLENWQDAGSDMLQTQSESLASLCFALQAMLGPCTRLADTEERQLFDLASSLWGASLQALSGAGGATAAAVSAALDRMGSDLFAVVDGDSDATQDCARYVSYFSGAARSWAAAGQREKAKWCVERAMRYSQQLEALVAREDIGLERKEAYVVALCSLYLEGAKSATDNKQQALANNLLSRAVQLTRHQAVGPDAAACCATAVAELQVEQAEQMLAKGGPMCSLAAALLSSSYQQLTSEALQQVVENGSPHLTNLKIARKQVLTLLCKAHLASGDATLACKVLDALEAEVPGAAAAERDMQLLFVEATVAAGRAPEALRFLMMMMQQPNLPGDPGVAAADAAATFLAGLRLALRSINDTTLPSFQSAVSSFVWKAAAASPPTPLLHLVQALLAQEQGGELCQRLVLQALSAEDVSASLHRDAGVLAQVHSLLFHRAAHCLEAGSTSAAKELFSAALQFAQPEARAKNARALATCHRRLGMHQRAAEYLDIAARHEQQPSSLTQLSRLQALAYTADASQAATTIRSLASCPDFHPSLIPTMCQAAAKAHHPAVYKEALSTAVQLLIKSETPTSLLPTGQEAELLLGLQQAIDSCLKTVSPALDGVTELPVDGSAAILYGELVAAVKLVARRLKLLGWDRFVGQGGDKTSIMQAICALAYNQLLAAQHFGAHEHAVALATATFQLMPLVDKHLQIQATGLAQQAHVLMLAVQALLDLHRKEPESGQKLALATKLQARLAQHMSCLDVEQHLQLHLLHHCLSLDTAARQGDGAALLQCLSRLQPHAASLTAAMRNSILSSVGNQHSTVVQDATAQLLLDSISADGTLLSMALMPTILSQLSVSAEVHVGVIVRCQQILAAIPLESRCDAWLQCAQWLAVHSWNAGTKLAQSVSGSAPARGLLSAAMQLQDAGGAAASNQLRRMEAAMSAAGLRPPDDIMADQGGPAAGGTPGVHLASHSSTPPPILSASRSAAAKPAVQLPVQAHLNVAETSHLPSVSVQPPADEDMLGPKGCSTVSASLAVRHETGDGVLTAQTTAATEHVMQTNQLLMAAPVLPARALPASMVDAHAEPAAALARTQAVPPTPASASLCADGEDSLSEDSDKEGAASRSGWLTAMLAAQKRALGHAISGPSKRRTLQAPTGRHVPAPAGQQLAVKQQGHPEPQQQPASQDDMNALSLGDSLPGDVPGH